MSYVDLSFGCMVHIFTWYDSSTFIFKFSNKSLVLDKQYVFAHECEEVCPFQSNGGMSVKYCWILGPLLTQEDPVQNNRTHQYFLMGHLDDKGLTKS
jgi:hypothetical protein